MIRFNWVEFSNFLSTGAHPVRITLNTHDTTLIRGKNGCGKTTVLDAINYALFNKPLRDVKLAQLVNSVNKKKMLVKINFTINGKNYEIHRGQKPSVFQVFIEGEQIDQDASARDLQAKVENEILGCNFRTFNQVVVIASTGYTYFMELSAAERRDVVEKMLDIEVLGHMVTLLKERVKEVKAKGASIENKTSQIQQSISHARNLIAQAQQMGDEQVEQLDQHIAEVDQAVDELNAELQKLRSEHEELQKEKPEIDLDSEKARHQEAEKEINELAEVVRQAKSHIHVLENEVSTDKKTKSFYNDNDHCDRCHQPIDEEFKRRVNDKMDENILQAENKIHQHTQSIEEQKELAQAKQAIIKEVEQLAAKLRQWNNLVDGVLHKARNVQGRISDQMNTKNRLVDNKNQILSKGTQDIGKYYDEIAKLEGDLEDLAKNRAEVTEEEELCRLAGEMLKDKGLKAKVIKQFLPLINHTINHYLDSMDANYSFVLDEQFNETIKSRYRDTFSYGSFSNGQRMRINLAILFMWRKLAESKNTVSSNLLFIDEVLDGSLDTDAIDSIFRLFETMTGTRIFVISHRTEIIEHFDRVIEVSMNGNFSQYDGLEAQ